MTAQIAETLIYEGDKVQLCAEPLDMYFELTGVKPGFEANCSALWRGYVGTWVIIDDRLYLVDISATLLDGTEAELETFFPGYPERVLAHWFSGTLRVPQGKQIEYIHAGYASKFERDLLLTIERGRVTNTEVKHNGVADNPDAPDEYGPGAMLYFADDNESEKGSGK